VADPTALGLSVYRHLEGLRSVRSPEDYAAHQASILDCERRSYVLRSRIPSRITDLWWSGSWRSTDASRRALQMIRSGARAVVLYGTQGTGKSCAAAEILLTPCAIGPDGGAVFCGLWISAADYCECCGRREDTDLVEDCRASSYLVVDDAGEEHQRDAWRIARLITDRYDSSHKRTVLTTNLTGDQFRNRYEARVYSRLMEIGGAVQCKVIERPGEVQR
jgi:hypothetical protein